MLAVAGIIIVLATQTKFFDRITPGNQVPYSQAQTIKSKPLVRLDSRTASTNILMGGLASTDSTQFLPRQGMSQSRVIHSAY